MWRGVVALPVLLVSIVAGCAAQSSGPPPAAGRPPNAGEPRQDGGGAAPVDGAPQDAQPLRRKIITTAELSLVVEDVQVAATRMEERLQQAGGFVSRSSLRGSPGSKPSGSWTLRVPVSQYLPIVAGLRELGEVQNFNSKADDVTADHYDLVARTRNKSQEETRLLAILSEATAKLDEILIVEKELSRVREEIERLQGRLRLMNDQTELATLTVHLTERPPGIEVPADSFLTRIGQTWHTSVTRLKSVVEATALVCVAVFPWLLTMAIASLIGWLPIRRLVQRPRPSINPRMPT